MHIYFHSRYKPSGVVLRHRGKFAYVTLHMPRIAVVCCVLKKGYIS